MQTLVCQNPQLYLQELVGVRSQPSYMIKIKHLNSYRWIFEALSFSAWRHCLQVYPAPELSQIPSLLLDCDDEFLLSLLKWEKKINRITWGFTSAHSLCSRWKEADVMTYQLWGHWLWPEGAWRTSLWLLMLHWRRTDISMLSSMEEITD